VAEQTLVKYLCSDAAAALLTEPHREYVARVMLAKAVAAGTERGQCIFATVTGKDGTAVKVALDRRLDPSEDCEWVVIFDPEGCGTPFVVDPARPNPN
jgi:hypothetical protein